MGSIRKGPLGIGARGGSVNALPSSSARRRRCDTGHGNSGVDGAREYGAPGLPSRKSELGSVQRVAGLIHYPSEETNDGN